MSGRESIDSCPKGSGRTMMAERIEGLPYGIIDPDYARIFTIARTIAWQEGYALMMHGSFTRDLDLLAVPWTDRACPPKQLVARITEAAGLKQMGESKEAVRPHGRRAWTLLFPEFGDPRFVDLSVMPCIMRESPAMNMNEPVITLIYEALRFAAWAAHQGIAPRAGEPAENPEDFLFQYAFDACLEDYSTIPDAVTATLRVLSEGEA